jgi:hypothetical protein
MPPYLSRRADPALPGALRSSADAEIEPDGPPRSPARAAREGLASHYRMRAEPHYVEALARPRAEIPPVTAARPPEPRVRTPLDRALGDASDALARALASVNQTLEDLPGAGRPLRERLLLELARAEAVRAGWLADAIAVLQQEPMPALDQVDLNRVAATVAEALGPEHRVTGETPRVTLAERPVTVFGDQRLLTVAAGGPSAGPGPLRGTERPPL